MMTTRCLLSCEPSARNLAARVWRGHNMMRAPWRPLQNSLFVSRSAGKERITKILNQGAYDSVHQFEVVVTAMRAALQQARDMKQWSPSDLSMAATILEQEESLLKELRALSMLQGVPGSNDLEVPVPRVLNSQDCNVSTGETRNGDDSSKVSLHEGLETKALSINSISHGAKHDKKHIEVSQDQEWDNK